MHVSNHSNPFLHKSEMVISVTAHEPRPSREHAKENTGEAIRLEGRE